MQIESFAPAALRPPGTPHLTFHGGKILENPKFVSLYYGDFWLGQKGREQAAYLDRFAAYLVKSDYTSIWKEYGVNEGRFDGSSVLPGRARSVDQRAIEALVKRHLSTAGPRDPETVYTVFLPPGAVLRTESGESSLEGLGGYHGSFVDKGKRIYYSALAYSQGANGIDFTGVPLRNITITASHEWSEAATDPDVNAGELGWYDDMYGEVADIPLTMGLPLDKVYGKLGGYYVQKEWSERDGALEVRSRSSN